MPTKRHRYMVSLPPEHEKAIVARAKAQGRSVANYLETLAVNDVMSGLVDDEVATLLSEGLTVASAERIDAIKKKFKLPPDLVRRLAEAMMVAAHPERPKMEGLPIIPKMPTVPIAPRADIHRQAREREKERA